MTQLHETGYGKRFFESQLPRLITELSRLANAVEESNRLRQLELNYRNEAEVSEDDTDEEFTQNYFAVLGEREKKQKEEQEELEEKLKDPAVNEGIPEKEYEIWAEGYRANGDSGHAHFFGRAKGITFREACKNYAKENESFNKLFNEKCMTYWGCGLFDSEKEARKNFG